MLVSIVSPVYNHDQYLPFALDSIVTQSRAPDEFLILDDASTDTCWKIIEQYASQYQFINGLRHLSNRGGPYTMNLVWRMASGDYVYGIAADDFIPPYAIEAGIEMAKRYPEAGIIFGKILVVDQMGNAIEILEVPGWNEPQFVSPARFLSEYIDVLPANHSLCGSTIYKRTALAEINYFRKELGSWCDTFSARAIALKYGACYVPEILHCWRYLPSSLSNSTGSSHLDMVNRAEALMLSPEFNDRFPKEHAVRWANRYRELLRS